MCATHLVRVLVEPRPVAKLRGGRAGDCAEQRVEQGNVLLTGWRKLQQYRAEPLAQESDPTAEDPGQSDPVETFRRIGEASVGFHAEAKARRGFRGPLRKRLFRRRAVEAAVDLDPIEPLGVVAQHLRAGELPGIELAFPACIAEAGRSGEEHRLTKPGLGCFASRARAAARRRRPPRGLACRARSRSTPAPPPIL